MAPQVFGVFPDCWPIERSHYLVRRTPDPDGGGKLQLRGRDSGQRFNESPTSALSGASTRSGDDLVPEQNRPLVSVHVLVGELA